MEIAAVSVVTIAFPGALPIPQIDCFPDTGELVGSWATDYPVIEAEISSDIAKLASD